MTYATCGQQLLRTSTMVATHDGPLRTRTDHDAEPIMLPNGALAVASDAPELRPGGCQGRARMTPWRWRMVSQNGAPAVARDAPE